MWAGFLLVAVNVGQSRISFAFNLGQNCALIAGRGVYESEPLQVAKQIKLDGILLSLGFTKRQKEIAMASIIARLVHPGRNA